MAIPTIAFRKTHKKNLEFEIFTIQSLFNRAPILHHSIEEPHRINFYIIQYITQGTGSHHIDFQSYPYDTGSLIFISKGQAQSFEVRKDTDGFMILFTESFISKNLIHSDMLSLYRLYNYHLHTPVLTGKEGGNDFKPLVREMYKEYRCSDDFAKEDILKLQLKLLLLKAEKIKRTRIEEEKNAAWLERFTIFQNHLEKGYEQTRNAKDYADKMGVSYKHLNEITRSITGSTAKEFIDRFLILEAKRQLATTDISIKELTYEMGFDEPTNFSKFFKKHTHHSPSKFRSFQKN